MRKRKFKAFVLPSLLMIAIVGVIFGTAMIGNSLQGTKSTENIPLSYVTNTILENELAVINTTKTLINPYTDQTVTIGKTYYDYKGEAQTQEKSIIYHNNTYMQNSGIDFVNKNVFDVVAILEGSVTNVKEDDTLGKIIEVKHDNGYVSVYQSLSEISVKKGDTITQGQVIAKSGTNELDKELGNHLHLELYVNGQVVDPTLYLNKEIDNSKTKE